jgi:hypothetical protein
MKNTQSIISSRIFRGFRKKNFGRADSFSLPGPPEPVAEPWPAKPNSIK